MLSSQRNQNKEVMSDDISESDVEEILGTPPEVCEAAEKASLHLLPAKSRILYENCYKAFTDWKISSQIASSSERVIMAYFDNLAKKYKPSTIWSMYSMLKTTIKLHEKLDINEYYMLSAFLKRQSTGFRSKKSKVYSTDEVKRFLSEAPDDKYLLTKVNITV